VVEEGGRLREERVVVVVEEGQEEVVPSRGEVVEEDTKPSRKRLRSRNIIENDE
jgi:hypothetical protein